jgi:hypothetical protein
MHATKIVAAVTLAAITLSACSTVNQEWHRGCTVTAKDTLYDSVDGNTTRTYRLSTSCGPFNVEDSLAGGFNSWDTWQALQVGKVYDIRSGGYRVGFASAFPTVLEIKAANA